MKKIMFIVCNTLFYQCVGHWCVIHLVFNLHTHTHIYLCSVNIAMCSVVCLFICRPGELVEDPISTAVCLTSNDVDEKKSWHIAYV